MLTKEYKVSDEMDNKVMEKLHNTQFYISKEDKPYEKAIKASDDMEINVQPKNPKEFNFDIETTKMTHIKPDDIIGRLNSYSRENIKVKDFDIDINYFNRVKEDTSFQHDILGLPTLKNFHPKGNASEWVENTSSNPPNANDDATTSNLNPISKSKQASSSHDDFNETAFHEFYEQYEKLEEEKKAKLTDPTITDKKKKELLKGYNKKGKSIEESLLKVTPIKPPLRKAIPFDENTPLSRKSNSKKLGEGYVKEEAKIIDEYVTPKKEPNSKLKKIQSIVDEETQIHKDVYQEPTTNKKEQKMEFDESDDEPTGKKVPIQFNSTDIAKYYDYMEVGKGKRLTNEKIKGIRKLFNNDDEIKDGMTKLQIEKYLTKTYKPNFAINKK